MLEFHSFKDWIIFHCMYAHFVYLFICQWAWVAFPFWLLWVMLLWTWVYKYLIKSQLSFLIGIYPEMEVLVTWHLTFLLSLLSFGVPHQFAFLYLRDVKVTHQTCLLLCFIDKHANVSLLPALSHRDDSPGRSTYQPTDKSKTLGTRGHAVAPVIWDGCTLSASHQK